MQFNIKDKKIPLNATVLPPKPKNIKIVKKQSLVQSQSTANIHISSTDTLKVLNNCFLDN